MSQNSSSLSCFLKLGYFLFQFSILKWLFAAWLTSTHWTKESTKIRFQPISCSGWIIPFLFQACKSNHLFKTKNRMQLKGTTLYLPLQENSASRDWTRLFWSLSIHCALQPPYPSSSVSQPHTYVRESKIQHPRNKWIANRGGYSIIKSACKASKENNANDFYMKSHFKSCLTRSWNFVSLMK